MYRPISVATGGKLGSYTSPRLDLVISANSMRKLEQIGKGHYAESWLSIRRLLLAHLY